MKNPIRSKRFPTWLRGLGWLCFVLLGLATFLLVGRWWLMESAHRNTMARVKQGRAISKKSGKDAGGVDASSSVQKKSAVSRGTPVSELPLLGVYLDYDSQAGKELRAAIDEMNLFLKSNSRLSQSRVGGVLSFRTLLGKMGLEVPESMTEAEAAAEFLKRADKYSAILAQWKEAVGSGPWDCSSEDDRYRATRGDRTALLTRRFPEMLGVMAEAHMRTGDTAAAWSVWQTMALSAERCGDAPAITPGAVGSIVRNEMIRTAHAGMELGAWTDDQLAQMSVTLGGETALASRSRDFEGEKTQITEFFADSPDPRQMFPEPLIDTDSPLKNVVNDLSVSLTTEQQIQDNVAVMIYRMDQTIDRFDPETGVYLTLSGGEADDSVGPGLSDTWFDKFYYMYSERDSEGFFAAMPERIIKEQSGIDQTRIAAALEMQRRATGEYPATLDAVSGTFGGSMPIDIATGQPYFYQREADGGYTLWGTGIDRKSEGGNDRTDVTWKHRPVKGK